MTELCPVPQMFPSSNNAEFQAEETDSPRHSTAQPVPRSLLSWARHSALGRALADRWAKRELHRVLLRLAETSPHLLADIGITDTPFPAEQNAVAAQSQAAKVALATSVSAGSPTAPILLRPALRPEIVAPQPVHPRSAVPTPVRSARLEHFHVG